MQRELSKNQFLVLESILIYGNGLTQRQISEKTSLSLGTVNRTLKQLSDMGYTEKSSITTAGIAAMEPYRAKRAVFIAAGFGSRLVPVTLNTPKPLVYVNGKRIIDGLINACLSAGINEIFIVRGYLSAQFDQLLYNYPMIQFIDNPLYNEANNISSALCARHLLSNAYVFEADLLISNPFIIRKYHYSSDFLAIKKERSDDWCFQVKGGFITSLSHGGTNCWQEVGISYWNGPDGLRLSSDILSAFEKPGGREYYWEQVPLTVFSGSYKVAVLECSEKDIIEIDTFSELKAIDKSYEL